MTTVRAARRWIYVRRHYTAVDRHALMTVACLCVAFFVVSFAVGRLTRPAGVPGEHQPSSVQLGSDGVAVPASLGVAPAVALKHAAPASVPASGEAPTAPLGSSSASAPVTPALTPAVPSSSPTETSPPTVQAAPLRTVGIAPAPTVPKSSGGGSGRSAAGTSFDTSG